MGITKSKGNIFSIVSGDMQYALCAGPGGAAHLHWGAVCPAEDFEEPPLREENSNHAPLDFIKTEYIPYGGTMYREYALKCSFSNGCRETALKYSGAEINGGTLEITLEDESCGLEVRLIYICRESCSIIERRAVIKNLSGGDILIEKAASAELHLPGEEEYEITNANGSWGAEFRQSRQTLKSGELVFGGRKGTTAHHHMPALIASRGAGEESGEVFFAVLGWGGSWKLSVSRDFAGRTSAVLGINDRDFSYTLKSGEEFETPPVYLGRACGFGDMSRRLNELALRHILPRRFAYEALPVLYNSWEATDFGVNEAQQLKLAKRAAEIGCELFVMDDGWFSTRNSDKSGLGDWDVSKIKFPRGLKPLIDGVKALGMEFGIWVEPEMVNPKSRLYKEHPDWAYHYDCRTPSLLRRQLVLNLTKPEVQKYIFDFMDKLLCENDIRYIKWDMNRPFSEAGAENLKNPRELWYRHTKAVFKIVDELRKKHPDVQFEACASGGGRTDLGSLSHFDMVWPSDNTDPLDRLEIQRGYSLLYPQKCMRAWVTDTNSEARPVSAAYRFAVSMQGALAVGSDLSKLSRGELAQYKKHIALYKKIRRIVQFGRRYRILAPPSGKIYLNGFVSPDGDEAVYFACTAANSFFEDRFVTLRFDGLDENAVYEVKSEHRHFKKSGAYLMNRGIDVVYYKPLESEIFIFKRIK